MPDIDWNTAIRYALLVKIAESVSPGGTYGPAEKGQIMAAGYEFLQTIYGDDLATDIDPHLGSLVTFGFVAASPAGELVVAIRGTDTLLEWLHDGAFLQVDCPVAGGRGLTEDGFTAIYKSLRISPDASGTSLKDAVKDVLDKHGASTVTICGHSLGGALATLTGYDIGLNTPCHGPTVYTYASPRTGDPRFANAYDAAVPNTFRVANRHDLVPKLPPILPIAYDHVGTLFELVPPPGQICTTIGCMHHLTTYLWLMGQSAGTPAYPIDSDCRFTAVEHV